MEKPIPSSTKKPNTDSLTFEFSSQTTSTHGPVTMSASMSTGGVSNAAHVQGCVHRPCRNRARRLAPVGGGEVGIGRQAEIALDDWHPLGAAKSGSDARADPEPYSDGLQLTSNLIAMATVGGRSFCINPNTNRHDQPSDIAPSTIAGTQNCQVLDQTQNVFEHFETNKLESNQSLPLNSLRPAASQ